MGSVIEPFLEIMNSTTDFLPVSLTRRRDKTPRMKLLKQKVRKTPNCNKGREQSKRPSVDMTRAVMLQSACNGSKLRTAPLKFLGWINRDVDKPGWFYPYTTPTFLRDLDNSTVMTTALEDSTLEG